MTGCKDDPEPQPVAQSYQIPDLKDNTNKSIKVTVNYTALPNVVPSYMTPLTTVVKTFVSANTVNGDLIINVISGDSSFSKTASKTLSVGETWITGKTTDDIGPAVGPLFNNWIAMLANPVYVVKAFEIIKIA